MRDRKGRKCYSKTVSFDNLICNCLLLFMVSSVDIFWRHCLRRFDKPIFLQSMQVGLVKLQNALFTKTAIICSQLKSHYCFTLLIVSNILYFIVIFQLYCSLILFNHLFWGYSNIAFSALWSVFLSCWNLNCLQMYKGNAAYMYLAVTYLYVHVSLFLLLSF